MEEKSTLQVSYDSDTINRVWEKARIIKGYNPQQFRKDICGAWICKDDYGKHDKLSLGWEIASFNPFKTESSVSTMRTYLLPMQWENYEKRGNDFPDVHCCVDSSHFEELKNVYSKS
jgi:hypothetical protein